MGLAPGGDEIADFGGAEQARGDELAGGDVAGAEEGAALGPVDAHCRRVGERQPAPDAGEESAGVVVREDDARPGGDERIGRQQARVERRFVEAVELARA